MALNRHNDRQGPNARRRVSQADWASSPSAPNPAILALPGNFRDMHRMSWRTPGWLTEQNCELGYEASNEQACGGGARERLTQVEKSSKEAVAAANLAREEAYLKQYWAQNYWPPRSFEEGGPAQTVSERRDFLTIRARVQHQGLHFDAQTRQCVCATCGVTFMNWVNGHATAPWSNAMLGFEAAKKLYDDGMAEEARIRGLKAKYEEAKANVPKTQIKANTDIRAARVLVSKARFSEACRAAISMKQAWLQEVGQSKKFLFDKSRNPHFRVFPLGRHNPYWVKSFWGESPRYSTPSDQWFHEPKWFQLWRGIRPSQADRDIQNKVRRLSEQSYGTPALTPAGSQFGQRIFEVNPFYGRNYNGGTVCLHMDYLKSKEYVTPTDNGALAKAKDLWAKFRQYVQMIRATPPSGRRAIFAQINQTYRELHTLLRSSECTTRKDRCRPYHN